MDAVQDQERMRELLKKKKKLMAKIKRTKKEQVRARIEKKRVNDELRLLRGKKNLFEGMETSRARDSVRKNIEAVRPDEVFPRDLERRFDRIDHPKEDQADDSKKIIDLGRIPEQPLHGARRLGDDDEATAAVIDEDEIEDEYDEEVGVVDLSQE